MRERLENAMNGEMGNDVGKLVSRVLLRLKHQIKFLSAFTMLLER